MIKSKQSIRKVLLVVNKETEIQSFIDNTFTHNNDKNTTFSLVYFTKNIDEKTSDSDQTIIKASISKSDKKYLVLNNINVTYVHADDYRLKITELITKSTFETVIIDNNLLNQDNCICKRKKTIDFIGSVNIPIIYLTANASEKTNNRVLIISDNKSLQKESTLQYIKKYSNNNESSVYNLNIVNHQEPNHTDIKAANKLKQCFNNTSFFQFHVTPKDKEFNILKYAKANVIDHIFIINPLKPMLHNWIDGVNNKITTSLMFF